MIFGPLLIFGLSRAKNNAFDVVCFWPFLLPQLKMFELIMLSNPNNHLSELDTLIFGPFWLIFGLPRPKSILLS